MDLKLQYSEVSKVPKICIDEKHCVVFVNEPALMPGGKFKYFRVSGAVTQIIKKGRIKNGERQSHSTIMGQESDICYLTFSDLSTDLKNLKPFKRLISHLKRIVGKYLDDNNLFPPSALDAFEEDLRDVSSKMEEENKKAEEKKRKKSDKMAQCSEREAKKKERELKKAEREKRRLIREEKRSIKEKAREQKKEK